jgi:peptide/nickel transport system permease protein
MLGFLLRRVGAGIVLIFVVSALMFALMSATGSDPARNIVGQTATQQQVDAKSKELGLDRPLITRYGD